MLLDIGLIVTTTINLSYKLYIILFLLKSFTVFPYDMWSCDNVTITDLWWYVTVTCVIILILILNLKMENTTKKNKNAKEIKIKQSLSFAILTSPPFKVSPLKKLTSIFTSFSPTPLDISP